jgi:hypothetical protein
MTPPTKRSVGRPRKNAKKQENPDCDVATKGFVKCVARRLGEHTHTNFSNSLWLWLFGIGSAVIFMVMYGHDTPSYVYENISMPTILITCIIVGLVGGVASAISNYFRTEASCDLYEVEAIQKHEEPPCEPKRGCEE